jgi:hypothetical protein
VNDPISFDMAAIGVSMAMDSYASRALCAALEAVVASRG